MLIRFLTLNGIDNLKLKRFAMYGYHSKFTDMILKLLDYIFAMYLRCMLSVPGCCHAF